MQLHPYFQFNIVCGRKGKPLVVIKQAAVTEQRGGPAIKTFLSCDHYKTCGFNVANSAFYNVHMIGMS